MSVMPRHLRENVSSTCFRLLLERLQIGAENLDRQRALQAGLGLVHGIFGRLGVVEDDPGKRGQLLLDRIYQFAASCECCAAPGRVVIRLQAHDKTHC